MPNIIKLFIISLLLLSVILCSSCAIIEKRTEEFDTKDDFISETASDSESESESEEIPVVVIPEYINPLTGLGVSEDVANNRPVAVMINNIKASMPQLGTSGADVIYECIVEGAQTRLMAVYLDYADIGAIGSVRSSREYYLDFAGNHDAIYVHAGGSDEAYRQIKASRVNNLDGVNMYLPSTFYRDEARVKSMPYEHTLMTSGEGIVDGIDYKGYRSEANADFKGPFEFAEFGEERFRDMESAAVLEVAGLQHTVIATGGGAVLRKENVNALKQNGKFYFLNRPLEELLPTDDRPLANNKEKIIKLYNQRIDIYKAVADLTVNVTSNPQTAISEILKSL